MIGLKFFNVYGPNEYHKADMRSMVAKAYEQIKQRRQDPSFQNPTGPDYRDGRADPRDFLYVKDAVNVVYDFMKGKSVGGLFNVGSAQARTWNDLSKAIFVTLGKSPKIDYIEMPDALRAKYQYHTQADMSWRKKEQESSAVHDAGRRRARLRCSELSFEEEDPYL